MAQSQSQSGNDDSSTESKPNYPESEIHSADGPPESISQMKDRIDDDTQSLKDDLIALNQMMVVESGGSTGDTVGRIDVRYDTDTKRNRDVVSTQSIFATQREHPFYVHDVRNGGIVFFHEDRTDYVEQKSERRKM